MNIENKVKVIICGKEYNLRTDEKPEYIKALAERIDKEIGDMVREKPNFGIQNAAVFVALTSLDEASKARESIENIRGQIKAYVNEAGKARSANERLSAKVKDLEQKISALEKENKELKKRTALYDCEQLVLENTVTPAVTVYAQELEKSKENHADNANADSPAPADNKPAPAVEEKSENNTSADSGDSASSGKSTDSGEKQEENEQAQAGEVTGAGSEGNAEAQGNGSNTQPDNVNPPKQNQQSRRGRKKKR